MHKEITVLVDNDSWILPFAKKLVDDLLKIGLEAKLVREHKLVGNGWINFMLGCIKIMPEECLKKNKHNLVVHESDLPKGKGFAPMTWQILEGENEIPICLIEATKDVDAGKIWLKELIKLDGTELSSEWRNIQGTKTIELCMEFVKNHQNLSPVLQDGEQTFYKRRTPENSELDINVSIKDQLNLLRVVDNENHPAFFIIDGNKYILKIEKNYEK
jgi:methionyl-tRNA formyltransferase